MSDDSAVPSPTGYETAFRLCERKVTSSDSGDYYDLLFLPAPARAAAVTLRAFWLEVREINDECSEPDIARFKLAWWTEEIREVFAGHPRHPIGCALAPVVIEHRLSEETFLGIVGALAHHADISGYPTFEALHAYGNRSRGQLEALLARTSGCHAPAVLAQVATLGGLVELALRIRDCGIDARRGRVYLPQEDLDRFAVTTADLRSGKDGEAVCALLRFTAARLATQVEQALRGLSPPDGSLLALVASAHATRALLARIVADPARVLHARLRIKPLQQLWMTWRTARRLRRPVNA